MLYFSNRFNTRAACKVNCWKSLQQYSGESDIMLYYKEFPVFIHAVILLQMVRSPWFSFDLNLFGLT